MSEANIGRTVTATHTEKYEVVVGLEVHVQLRTRTKLFCNCPTDFGAAPKSVEQLQKALVRVLSCTCTSSPTTISYFSPSGSAASTGVVVAPVALIGGPPRRARPRARRRRRTCPPRTCGR